MLDVFAWGFVGFFDGELGILLGNVGCCVLCVEAGHGRRIDVLFCFGLLKGRSEGHFPRRMEVTSGQANESSVSAWRTNPKKEKTTR